MKFRERPEPSTRGPGQWEYFRATRELQQAPAAPKPFLAGAVPGITVLKAQQHAWVWLCMVTGWACGLTPIRNWSALVHSEHPGLSEGIQFHTEWEVDRIGTSLRTLLFQAEVSRQTYPFISFQVSLDNNLSILQVIMQWSIYQYFLLTATTDVFCMAAVLKWCIVTVYVWELPSKSSI